MNFETLIYRTEGAIATITLNRPRRLNSIVPPMPEEIEAAVRQATLDEAVRVIVLRGAGRSFCAGFDFLRDFASYGEKFIRPTGSGTPARTSPSTRARSTAPVPMFMAPVALPQAGDRSGPRLAPSVGARTWPCAPTS